MKLSTDKCKLQHLRNILDEAFEVPWEKKHKFSYDLTLLEGDHAALTIKLMNGKKNEWVDIMNVGIDARQAPRDAAADILSRLLASHVRWS